MTSVAMVLGVNGQDGSYLAEHLSARGHRVVGVGRQERSREETVSIFADSARGEYRAVDLRVEQGLRECLRETRPDLIFHVAAVHGSAGFEYEDVWRDVLAVNTGSLHTCLEWARKSNGTSRIVYASSSKVFGDPLPAVIDEGSEKVSSCLYSISKNAAHELIDYYRGRHGVTASTLFLFNHDSPRRPRSYFLPGMVHALLRILKGDEEKWRVKTLDFWCNWGCAREFMELAVDIADKGNGQDFVMAGTRTVKGRDVVAEFFSRFGLNYEDHVDVETFLRPDSAFQVSCAKLQNVIGKAPGRTVLDVCEDILNCLKSVEHSDSLARTRLPLD